MIIGFAFASGSAIFEVERWSMAKQTVMHFILLVIVYFPCAIIGGWIEPSLLSIVISLFSFIFIYALIWFVQYYSWKRRILKLNKRLQEK